MKNWPMTTIGERKLNPESMQAKMIHLASHFLHATIKAMIATRFGTATTDHDNQSSNVTNPPYEGSVAMSKDAQSIIPEDRNGNISAHTTPLPVASA